MLYLITCEFYQNNNFTVWKKRCFSSWNEIPWNLNNWSFVLIWSGNKLEHVKICPEMAIPFFDQLYCQCLLFPLKYLKYLLYFFKIQHIFFQSKNFYLKWVQKRSKKYISSLWVQIRKIRKPYFYRHINSQWFLGQPLGFARLVAWFLNICSCFLIPHRTQTASIRGKSQGLLNKTIFPIGAKGLLVILWKYKEADSYMDVLH